MESGTLNWLIAVCVAWSVLSVLGDEFVGLWLEISAFMSAASPWQPLKLGQPEDALWVPDTKSFFKNCYSPS